MSEPITWEPFHSWWSTCDVCDQPATWVTGGDKEALSCDQHREQAAQRLAERKGETA